VADSTLGLNLDAFPELGRSEATAAPNHEDELLLAALKEGAEDAYEVLISRFQQPVYNLVYRLMDDPGDACDVVQEVFLKVFRNIHAFRGQSSIKTWIYRIAFNEAHNHRRWFSRHKRQEIGFETEDEKATNYNDILPDPGRSAFDIASDHETQALIEEALSQVNPSFRAAVVLRDIEDLSYEEIAEILQVSLGTVKSRILRGRDALRKALAARLKPESPPAWSVQPAQAK
jgi:RNA polymerase sigma-70 factor (ECF subfamily)